MRLEITRKSDLAVSSMQIMAASSERVKGPKLAEMVGSTPGFLSQVLTPLVRAGWVQSDPGPAGGYSLATDPRDVSILAVIEVIEGPTDSGRCVLADRPCNKSGTCALHVPWQLAQSQLLAQLDAVSVVDSPAVLT